MKSKSLSQYSVPLAFAALVATASLVVNTSAEEKMKNRDQEKQSTTVDKTKLGNIVAVADEAGKFKTLVAALKAADLVETLEGKGPFTVFAPTDEAFAKLPKATLDDLLKPENKKKLAAILTYHVLPSKVMAADVKTMKAETVNGETLDVVVNDGTVTVNKAKVIMTDVAASNGVIHAIDTVLMPK